MPTLDHDGVALFFEEAGAGGPPFVLIHCWGGDHTLMVRQFAHLRAKHRVLSVDLRGHGRSDKPAQAYSIAGFADDVAWLAAERGISNAVIVGHSMGGSIALDLAARHPGLVAGIVMLEALVVAPPSVVDAFWPVLEALKGPGYEAVMRQFNDQLLGPTFDPVLKERLLDQYALNPQTQMVSALESALAYDSATAAEACKVAALYVSTGPWYTDVERFRRLCPRFVTAQTVGSGHHLQLEVPEQVNAMIDGFLRVHVTRGA